MPKPGAATPGSIPIAALSCSESRSRPCACCGARNGIPRSEIGVGTGRFALALGIEQGVGVAAGALAFALAQRRGIGVRPARGEALPFAEGSFRCVALITSLSFMADPEAVLREAHRVLVPGGHVLIAEIPRDSLWGRNCQRKKKAGDAFFAATHTLSVEKIVGLLTTTGFEPVVFASTLLRSTPVSPQSEEPVPSRSEGAGFVGVLAKRR